MNYKDYFKGKRILVLGLGDDLEMLSEIRFLIKNKAQISVFDLRSEARLSRALIVLKSLGVNDIHTGLPLPHEIPDIDMVLMSQSIPYHSRILDRIRAKGIPIEYPETLLIKLAPAVTTIGVTGCAGTSTVSHLIYNSLLRIFNHMHGERVYMVNPDSQSSTIALIKNIKKGDALVIRIPENQIYHYVDSRVCPNVMVVTVLEHTVGAHKNTHSIRFKQACGALLDLQTYNNFLIGSNEVINGLRPYMQGQAKSKILRTGTSLIPKDWYVSTLGMHMKENYALVLRVGELFKVPIDTMRDILENFKGLKGRFEHMRKGGVTIYNDSYSRCPISVLAGLISLKEEAHTTYNRIIVILGGSGGDITPQVVNLIDTHAHRVIVLPGSAYIHTHHYKQQNNQAYELADSVDDAFKRAYSCADKNDCIVFSPGSEPYGLFTSRNDRYEYVQTLIRKNLR